MQKLLSVSFFRKERRKVLSAIAALPALGVARQSASETISGDVPYQPGLREVPKPIDATALVYLKSHEADLVGAIADRLIPGDALSIGAKEAGCVTFIDRQLAGDFGNAVTQFRRGPFVPGTPEQGPQFSQTPAQMYRSGLVAFERYCQQTYHKSFVNLSVADQDAVLEDLEANHIKLDGTDGDVFFNLVLQNVREGFFADPMYGGNKDMAGWKMIGFPGARYDFRQELAQRGKKLPIIPISLIPADSD